VPSELRGQAGGAANRVDLLTVVMHELGHELGMADVDGTVAVGDLMAETLTPGVRRLPLPLASVNMPVSIVSLVESGIALPPNSVFSAVTSMAVSRPSATVCEPERRAAKVVSKPVLLAVASRLSLYGEVTMLKLPTALKPVDGFSIGGVYLD